jgi:hypothetical protein
LTILEAAIEMEAASKVYFPEDRQLHALDASIRAYAEQLEKGSIDKDRYTQLKNQRIDRFNTARGEFNAEQQRQLAAQMAAEEEARKSRAIGNFFGNMSNSMRRAYPPATNCTSTAVGAQIVTNCR